MEQNTQIQLIQAPVFKHELVKLGASIKQRIEDLRLDDLAVNDETIQGVKKLRATFNNEKKEVDINFKEAISPATSIIDEIKAVKKEHVDAIYLEADSLLKDKIAAFEITIKTEKKNAVVAYFTELCAAEKIDFLRFENLGIEINLSTTEKAYKEQVHAFVSRVTDDLVLINSLDFAAEMLTEYKSNGLNASGAISKVKTRKEAEKLEAERIKQVETDRREKMLRDLTMVFHSLTNSFNYVGDDSIFITKSEINGLSKEEFTKLFVEIEAKIKAKIEESKPKPTLSTPSTSTNTGLFTAPTVSTPQPLPEPVEVVPVVEEKKLVARFEVTGTMAQLMALKNYLIENKLTYTNLKQQ